MQSSRSARHTLRSLNGTCASARRCLRTRSAAPARRRPLAARPETSEHGDVERQHSAQHKVSAGYRSGSAAQDGASRVSRKTSPSEEPPQPRSQIQIQPTDTTSTPPPPPTSSSPPLTYPPPQTSYASYLTTSPPNTHQLAYSTRFFTTGTPPTFLFSSAKFRTLPRSSVPEVAFIGRSNVGKSSLLNALVQRTGVRLANVSGKPGRTRTMNAFGVGGVRVVGGKGRAPQNKDGRQKGKGRYEEEEQESEEAMDEYDAQEGVVRHDKAKTSEDRAREHEMWVGRGGLVVLDMPGYGKASREEWGTEIMKYLTGRKQLRRIFLLIDSTHGPKPSDLSLLRLLSTSSLPHQIVLTKLDRLLLPSSKTSTTTFLSHLSSKFPTLCQSLREQLEREVYTDQRGRKVKGGMRVSGDILGVSGEVGVPKGERGRKMGVDALRWEVLCAAGLECDGEGRARVVDVREQEQQEQEHDL